MDTKIADITSVRLMINDQIVYEYAAENTPAADSSSDDFPTAAEALALRAEHWYEGYRAEEWEHDKRFATWYNNISGHEYTAQEKDDWCAEFVSLCMHYDFLVYPMEYKMDTPCLIMVNSYKNYTGWKNWFRENGSLQDTPQVGDVVFMNSKGDGYSTHCGIVVEVNSPDDYTVICGNDNGSCRRYKPMEETGKYVQCFGRLNEKI